MCMQCWLNSDYLLDTTVGTSSKVNSRANWVRYWNACALPRQLTALLCWDPWTLILTPETIDR